MYREILYAFDKYDYFKYLVVTIIIFIVLQNFSIVNSTNIIAVVLTAFIVKMLVDRKVFSEFSKMENINANLVRVNIDKYKNIAQEIDVINNIVSLSPLAKKNRIKFNSFIKRIDNFFYVYGISKNINANNGELYGIAKDEAREALNILVSFYIDSEVYPKLDRDRNYDGNEVLADSANIDDGVDRLKNIFNKYLNEMEIAINREWNSGDVNIYSKPVYPDFPESSIIGDRNYDSHFSIY